MFAQKIFEQLGDLAWGHCLELEEPGTHRDIGTRPPRVTRGAGVGLTHMGVSPSLTLCFRNRTSAFCDFLGVDAMSNLLKTSAIRSRGKKDAISVRSAPLAFLG